MLDFAVLLQMNNTFAILKVVLLALFEVQSMLLKSKSYLIGHFAATMIFCKPFFVLKMNSENNVFNVE